MLTNNYPRFLRFAAAACHNNSDNSAVPEAAGTAVAVFTSVVARTTGVKFALSATGAAAVTPNKSTVAFVSWTVIIYLGPTLRNLQTHHHYLAGIAVFAGLALAGTFVRRAADGNQ